MRCLWEISIRSPLREIFQRPLRNISKDVFFVMSLRRLKYISKNISFSWRLWDVSKSSLKRRRLCDAFKTSRTYLSKRCLFREVSETSQKHLSQVFLVFQKYVTKMISCNFRRLITISDKIDVGPSETLKKWNVLWEQCIDINQSSLPSGLISTWEFWQVKDRQNPIVSVLFTTFSDFFRLIKLYITCCHYELC